YDGMRAAMGVPEVRLADAGMLLCFGAEFLETWVSNVEYSREFSAWRQARAAGRHRGRYVFISPRLSLTGANADEWIPIRPGTEAHAAEALAQIVEAGTPGGSPGTVRQLADAAGVPVETLERIARELAAAQPSLVFPPGAFAAAEAHTAVLRLNRAAGNIGRTFFPGRAHALSAASTHADLLALAQRMKRGEVRLLFIHEANPAYHFPEFAEALAGVPAVVCFSSFPDETTSRASLVLPGHTPLESWGEYSPRPGITGLMQPAVAPVFDTRHLGDLFLASAARQGRPLGAADFHASLRAAHTVDDGAWSQALERGGVFSAPGEPEPGPATRPPAAAGGSPPHSAAPAGTLSLLVYPSLHFYDGRTANRPWAQEVPDPLAKAVWGSWVEIHPETARRLGAKDGDLLALATGGKRIEAPALVTERVHPEALAMQLGQGHTAYGRYATGAGANPLTLFVGGNSGPLPVTVAKLPVRRELAVLQTSQRQIGPEVARAMPLEELERRRPERGNRKEDEERASPSLYHYHPPGEHRWGMAIDLDRCIGCNACVAACYAENNVPVVGPEECRRGREMAWLRIENYVGEQPSRAPQEATEPEAPHPAGLGNARDGGVELDLRFLPMLCQQCDNAPCEYVCPVNATVHSSEGLNQQVYNRCVGTRFCSN
ncbi:MAG TPA: molybdopterin dinucleotide binding domain-containing protein, partial [Armatimonadota bacterium]|nr:molybdopterin dinucleotide binding domain-containing protein [Armatimonadota bacterium]